MPFGRGEKIGVILEMLAASELPPEKLKPVRDILRDMPPLPPDWLALADFCSGYYQHPVGEVMALALPPALRRRNVLPRLPDRNLFRITEEGRRALPSLMQRSIAARLLAALESNGAMTRDELRAISAAAAKQLPDLLEKGWLQAEREGRNRKAAVGPELLEEQRRAVDFVTQGFGRFAPYLLHGVTGSGKTEVYLRLIAGALERGGQALLLVPEIALTPQLEERVSNRFPGARLVSLHSSMAEGARAAGFLQALSGEADIVLGTRLSVFTPLPRLALIVVDEEHDPSFKQQEGMRYSARDVAVWRAKQRGVPVVLGSATPSLETWAAAQSGRYTLLELTARAVAEAMPEVRCVDTRREKLQDGMSEHLLRAIAARLERGEQSLVFLNRRGYAPVLACPSCGWVSRCPGCAANLVVHLADKRLRCHHCGREERIPVACPTCGNQDIHPFGRGTQRLEEALAARFPQARILRVDRDNTKSQSRWHAVLEAIHKGEADILVGTQMLAKGHDFPNLTLVGVLNADAALFAADFRAPERLFAQLMQVGGRSGRAALPGQVLVQTQYPEHPLYRALAAHDFAAFAAGQLAERERAGFPPFTHQAMLRAEAPELKQALAFLQTAAEIGAGLATGEVALYDAVPMRLHRLAHLERAQLLAESRSRPALQAFLSNWLAAVRVLKAPRALRWHIDVDPLEF
ncbi:MAG: primosomal protein N' [Rhodocyclaceae bacterium]|uniref:Replication restart protein PriA n=1 Tax=Candidatus Desulfobacillus denitrificans TaxID=2608985 RepID=A0A809QV85_9PROT|nr:primosomal protein N' [Candidatus Desulfobacillus denitrificans]GIK45490.1 MAG: primosomal protein N' [Betaproteobacteria bacterium]GJQ54378.1 MAG: primosomal protein N' [Rhodocyclaceae bacterium]